MKSRVESKDKEERAKDGSLDEAGGGKFDVGKVASVSDLEGAVAKIVFEVVKEVALNVGFVNVVEKGGDVECVVGVLEVKEYCCCVLSFGET